MSDRARRRLAVGLGVVVLGWQGINLATGRFWHEYLVADAVAACLLIASALDRAGRRSAVGMLVGFSMFAGIFLAATTGRLVVGGAHPGTLAAAVGLAACICGIAGAARRP